MHHSQSFLVLRDFSEMHTMKAEPCAATPDLCGGWSLFALGWCCLYTSKCLNEKKSCFFFSSFELMFNLYTGGVVATWSGVNPSECVTSPQAGICFLMKRKDSCLWMRKKQIQRTLLSAFVLQRFVYCSHLYILLSGRLPFWKCFLTIFDVKHHVTE